MEFKKLQISDLKPASYNPRKELKPGDKEYEKIKNSITEFGYVDPVIVNDDMTVIGGHQRLNVLKDLGYKEIDCVVISIDKTKEKALNIALNKITGEWNQELLADLIKDLQDSDFDVAFTGFEPPEIEQLFKSLSRRCHPDVYVGNPEKMALAEELFKRVMANSTNYKELVQIDSIITEQLES